MARLLPALLVWTALLALGSTPEYDSAKQKIEKISSDEAPRGSTTTLTPAEVNAYVRGQAAEEAPDGLKEIKVELRQAALTWSGLVNFAKLPALEGLGSNWLLSRILQGEKPVVIEARLQSAGGKATVDVDSVTISETKFEGRTLDFLVEKLLASFQPDAKIGEPFDLKHNVEYVRLRPTGIVIKQFD